MEDGDPNLGALRPVPSDNGHGYRIKTPLPYMYYIAERDHSASKGVGINKGYPKMGSDEALPRCNSGVPDPLKIKPPPILYVLVGLISGTCPGLNPAGA